MEMQTQNRREVRRPATLSFDDDNSREPERRDERISQQRDVSENPDPDDRNRPRPTSAPATGSGGSGG